MDIPEDMMLVDVLHEYLGLTGTRFGCGQGVCRACTVIVDDEGSARSAQLHHRRALLRRQAHPHRGRARPARRGGDITELSPVQQAFLDHFSFQCGYCTPGFVNAATVLIERLKKTPVARQVETTIREALEPHLCRCTGYVRYYQAVKDLVLKTPGLVRDDGERTP